MEGSDLIWEVGDGGVEGDEDGVETLLQLLDELAVVILYIPEGGADLRMSWLSKEKGLLEEA